MPDFMNQKCGTMYETLSTDMADVFFLLLNKNVSLLLSTNYDFSFN